jgi:hypothetical protein
MCPACGSVIGKSKVGYYGHPLFYEYTEQEKQLHSDKNYDYVGSGDPMGNFHRVAMMVDRLLNPNIPKEIRPAVVSYIYMAKQFDAVGDMLGNWRQPKVEGFDGRLMDISVYSKIMRILINDGVRLLREAERLKHTRSRHNRGKRHAA